MHCSLIMHGFHNRKWLILCSKFCSCSLKAFLLVTKAWFPDGTCGTGGSAGGTTWDMSQADFFDGNTCPGTADSLPAVPGELS